MSLAETYHVHLGFWTNWSHGKFEGATLTLTRRNGGLLVAFIAIFIGAVGKSFWRIACFILHRMLSSPKPQDGIYHQLQAVLRNSNTAQDAAWSLGHVIWAWRVPANFRKPFPRLFAIIALALFTSVSFGVAGVFSSNITTDTANEVLLTGNRCGPWDGNDIDDPKGYATIFQPLQWKRVTTYANYALQCYTGNVTAGQEDCHPYLKPKLKISVTRNASCPFAEEMCKSQTENLIIDTGLMDSHHDLGLNAPSESRFQMRLVHHCAPIVTKGFSGPFQANDTNEERMRYYYGPLNPLANYTQEMPMLDSDFNIYNRSTYRPSRSRPRADYGINVLKVYGGTPYITETFSMFTPISQLYREDADVMLFFLSSPGILFTEAVDDPWFSAHRKGPLIGNVMANSTRSSYVQDESVGVMGCSFQMQYCNPNIASEKDRCTPLAGYVDDRFDVTSLYKGDKLKTKFRWAVDVFQSGFFSISGIVDAMGVSSLVARQGLASNTQSPLPKNQWMKEVEHWVGASLASIQGSFVEMANGPPGDVYEGFRRKPDNSTQQGVCSNMKIMTTKYSSFSVLGIALILIFGFIVIFLDLFLEPIIDYLHANPDSFFHLRFLRPWGRKRSESDTPFDAQRREKARKTTYARLEWNANTTLHLQRLAHEHLGIGTWRTAGWVHPVTLPGEKLALINMEDEKHTTFVLPNNQEWNDDKKEKVGSYSPASGWTDDNSEEVRHAKTTDPKVEKIVKIRRVGTMESLASHTVVGGKGMGLGKVEMIDSTESPEGIRKVGRIDTGNTLVDGGDEIEACVEYAGEISPDMLRRLKSFEDEEDGQIRK